MSALPMKATRKLSPPDTAWLAVTLAILSLGCATLAWEWRYAHTAERRHGKVDAGHNRRIRSSKPETTTARMDERAL